jgi:hypothetical protein
MTAEPTANSQWVFPISALSCTPTAQERSLHEEMYDRSRGIEFLYRLGTSIGLFVWRAANSSNPRFCRYAQPTLVSLPQSFPWPIHGCDVVPSLLYAVFYARLSSPSQSLSQLLSWPPHPSLIRHQTIAAACVFLATKTEECGRKLRDVARVCQSKAKGIDVRDIPESGPVRFLRYLSRNVLKDRSFHTFFAFHRKLMKFPARSSPPRRSSWRHSALTLSSTVHMPTSSTCSTRMTWHTGFKTTPGASHTTRQFSSMPMPMPRLCSDCDTSDFQVPHSPLCPLPTENHRYCLLHSRSTDRRWPTFPILRCPRVAIGTIGFIAHPSNP